MNSLGKFPAAAAQAFLDFSTPKLMEAMLPLTLLTYYTAFHYSFFSYIKVRHKEEVRN